MRATRILRIELATHAHATEDLNKVRKALLYLIPEGLHEKTNIREVTMQGHYSNPITRLVVEFEGVEAERVVEHIAGLLDDYEKSILRSTLDQRYERKSGGLYIRFSKQDAYLGRLRVYEGDDVIRMVVVFRGSPSLKEVDKLLQEKGLIQ